MNPGPAERGAGPVPPGASLAFLRWALCSWPGLSAAVAMASPTSHQIRTAGAKEHCLPVFLEAKHWVHLQTSPWAGEMERATWPHESGPCWTWEWASPPLQQRM